MRRTTQSSSGAQFRKFGRSGNGQARAVERRLMGAVCGILGLSAVAGRVGQRASKKGRQIPPDSGAR